MVLKDPLSIGLDCFPFPAAIVVARSPFIGVAQISMTGRYQYAAEQSISFQKSHCSDRPRTMSYDNTIVCCSSSWLFQLFMDEGNPYFLASYIRIRHIFQNHSRK